MILFTMAISLDGYIADELGGYEWIKGCGNELDTKNEFRYEEFLKNVDTIILGSNCEEFITDFKDKKVYVVTTKKSGIKDNVEYIDNKIFSKISEIEGNIFIFGGGNLASQFIERNLIDKYILGIIPTILGKGRKLFLSKHDEIKLKLIETSIKDGVVMITYTKR